MQQKCFVLIGKLVRDDNNSSKFVIFSHLMAHNRSRAFSLLSSIHISTCLGEKKNHNWKQQNQQGQQHHQKKFGMKQREVNNHIYKTYIIIYR